jgi:sugar/nucleoside kinase (ribokinase family)
VPFIAGVGAVFIDDIVLPAGTTHMEQLGGGVIHAMMGAALWDEKPGLVALAGNDPSKSICDYMSQHLDTRGLRRLPIPQIRAWQIFEHDGSRRELYRVQQVQPFITGAQPEDLPDSYQPTTGFYLLQDFAGIRRWRQSLPDGLLLWEPLQQIMTSANRTAFHEAIRTSAVDIASPNLAEARNIYGDRSPGELVDAMLAAGARIAALRMGRSGSLIGRYTGDRYEVPAFSPAAIIDQTGAGNAYCGALLLGIARGLPLAEAGAMAAVSASFCLEQVGVINPAIVTPAERDNRYQIILEQIKPR